MSEEQQQTLPTKRFKAEGNDGRTMEGAFASIVERFIFTDAELIAVSQLNNGGVLRLGACVITRLA